ncbi:MAG: hypothetical protein Q4F31_05545 [Eubacteriales bacterium]|nr:hypothetical protein [Eubacteriales bacterium]
MINIEKRKFLAELGRLLTFMYDEDRQTALSMYGEMFDRTDDPEELLKLLVSPTRQAVVIARTYNAKERDLAVRSKTGDGDADVDSLETPRFVRAISEISEKASELFPTVNYSGAWNDSDYTESEPENQDAPADFEESEPEDNQNNRSDDPFSFAVAEFPVFGEDKEEDLYDRAADEEEGYETFSEPQESSETDYPAPSYDLNENLSDEDRSNRINEYMAAFADSEKENLQNSDVPKSVPVQEEIRTWRDRPVQEKKDADTNASREESAGEISVPLLILYIILAVPLTAIGVLLLLIPAILCLAISLILIVIGFQAITTAFGGFAVFADIMVVLGGALVVIAVALCALWAFIWFIGGAIVSLINSAIRLGGKFCTSGGGK